MFDPVHPHQHPGSIKVYNDPWNRVIDWLYWGVCCAIMAGAILVTLNMAGV